MRACKEGVEEIQRYSGKALGVPLGANDLLLHQWLPRDSRHILRQGSPWESGDTS